MTKTKLSVNINKVALIRNTRNLGIPSLTKSAKLCLEAGCHGITIHPRPDERHIRSKDVYEIAEFLKDYPQAEFNIEGNPSHNLMKFIEDIRPHQATFVPDSVEQFTSDHGWNLPEDNEKLKPFIQKCKDLNVRVSLFMDTIPSKIIEVQKLKADRIELYTEPFAKSFETKNQEEQLNFFNETAKTALSLGLKVNAGHDLNLENLNLFLSKVQGVSEVSIGHALISDALEFGYFETVKKYLACIP